MRWTGQRGDWEEVSQNLPSPARQRGLVGMVPSSPTSRPHSAPLTCEAEPQHSQGSGHTHTRAARSTQHLPVRQLTAGLSVVEGCPCLRGRGSEAFVSKRPPQALSHLISPGPAWWKAATARWEVLPPIPAQGSLLRDILRDAGRREVSHWGGWIRGAGQWAAGTHPF